MGFKVTLEVEIDNALIADEAVALVIDDIKNDEAHYWLVTEQSTKLTYGVDSPRDIKKYIKP